MDRYDLDHVALAAADTAPALRFLTGALGGTVIFGGQGPGFRPMQVWVGDADGAGMSVELLEPLGDRAQRLPRPLRGAPPAPGRTTSRSRCRIWRRRSSACAHPGTDPSTSTSPTRSGRKRSSCHGRRTAPSCSSRRACASSRRAPSCSPTCAPTDRTCTRAGGSIPSRTRGRRRSCDAWCCARRASRRRWASSAACCTARSTGETETSADLRLARRRAAPSRSSSATRAPGIDRLEVEGLDAAVEVVGTRFVPAP